MIALARMEELETKLAEAQAEVEEAEDVRDGWQDYANLYKGYANKWSKDNAVLRAQLAASQAEVERLQDLYNSDRANYLDDITLLQAEVGRLRARCDMIGDSLYQKDPDLAERMYKIIPTWRREHDPR